ncbi:DUF4231 domain-containing protein [Nocardia bovistercoris]|uniref:DUF4231 domain-containing protein n=1 Tax=Nocardia bovistercoris TaxID=2785916 RepID=A0A931IAL8_9NOCA|nr:DUF4231 domain-containing protein [Nocardia bovistercoris]MBH0777834.1 DUF4231 domain-containing protein [Nocardia bovistercoris]
MRIRAPWGSGHWMRTARRDDQELPVPVVAKWESYRRGGRRHRRSYALTELAAIVGAAAIPVVAVTDLPDLVVALLGAAVLVATGVRTAFGLHESWMRDSRVQYAIEREVALYLVQAEPYAGGGAAVELVKAVESITWESGRQWPPVRRERSSSTTVVTTGLAAD